MSAHATRFHRDAIVVDAHSDVFCEVTRRRQQGERSVLSRLHVPVWREAGVDVVVSTLYVEEEHKPDRALRRALALLGSALNDIDESTEVVFCRTRAEIDAAVAAGRIALILAMEGGEPLEGGAAALRVFYELGMRLLGLTWNQRNLLAEGIGEERANGGLTELGREMVEEANRLGILLDASHLSVRSFWDLIEASDAPVVISHGNAKALCGHRRNFDDEQVKAVAATGGVIGVTAVPEFLSSDPTQASIRDMLDHVDYLANLVGPEHVAIGPDCDYLSSGPDYPANFAEIPRVGGFATIAGMPGITAGLLERGYDDATIRGILGGHFLDVLTRVIG